MITGKGYTDKGGREYNEDTGFFGTKAGIGYAVIADGLGGHGNGGKASKMAAGTVKKCIEEWPGKNGLTEGELAEWFAEANQKVMEMQTPNCRMGTTLAFLYVDEPAGQAVLAHLGDSRIYHFENGKCVFCTFDHSVSRMAVLAGEISWEDIRFHVDRNKLIKVIGKAEEVKAETKQISLNGNSSHAFLLCTDGFWEYVTEEDMEKTLKSAKSPEEWLEKMRLYLAKRVKEGHDNNSAIAVWIT